MEENGDINDCTAGGTPRDFITLSQPRPGDTRRQNEYIETPLRPQLPAPKKSTKSRLKDEDSASDQCQRPITAQPTAKVKTATPPVDSAAVADGHNDSIICRQCRRCKCEACREPRHLPSKWICNDKCLCSAPATVDYCSCMCCVRGLFYHWAKDYEMDTDVSCADQPCSCSPHKRLLRWCCLGLLAFPLPCLCCYWPLRGCLGVFEKCYSKCTGHGCRCAPARTQGQAAPEKRLLDSNSDCWCERQSSSWYTKEFCLANDRFFFCVLIRFSRAPVCVCGKCLFPFDGVFKTVLVKCIVAFPLSRICEEEKSVRPILQISSHSF